MDSLFCCPICGSPFHREASGYRCTVGHCFDRSAAGYTHLLPANQKHSKNPGDDKAMVAARSSFLEHGYYSPLRDAICQLAVRETAPLPAPVLLDSGCGEGWYTAGLYQTLIKAGRQPQIAGVDISKFAVRKAAKRLPDAEFAVASVYHLPLSNDSVNLLTNVFSPLAIEEFHRVLRPGGTFLYVVPSARHLWEMKEVLYAAPYENPVKLEDYTGFSYQDSVQVRSQIHLDKNADIMALFGMTPYAWKTPKEGVDRLRNLQTLDTQIGFDIHLYQKNV